MSLNILKTIGLIGGGQLGKMIAMEAKRMAMNVVVLDPDPSCPASAVCRDQIVADFKNASAIRQLAERCDVLTYEIEQGNPQILRDLTREGFKIYPSAENLAVLQDKLLQKEFLLKNKIPVPQFVAIGSVQELTKIAERFGFPFLLKRRTDAYDGRGNQTIRSAPELQQILDSDYFKKNASAYMAERFVHFTKEISVMVARNADGQTTLFPVVENIHRDHILQTTIAPARIENVAVERARTIALQTVAALEGVGIFGIEMFLCADGADGADGANDADGADGSGGASGSGAANGTGGQILVNEIAPRPHNSAHYTMEACTHSQFEMQIRAIFNWPMVDPQFRGAAVMVNILGENEGECEYVVEGIEPLLSRAGTKLHLYGKEKTRGQRKLGHLTILDSSVEKALAISERARSTIKITAI